VQFECSDTGTVFLKYGHDILLETNLKLQQPYQSLPPQNFEANGKAKASNPPTTAKSNSKTDKLILPSKEAPDAQRSVSELTKRLGVDKQVNSGVDESPDADKLLRLLLERNRFDEEELKQICFFLFHKEPMYEEIINGRCKRTIARKLIEYLESRDRIDDLVNYLREHRPDIKEELYSC
jgi:hypothetical protein